MFGQENTLFDICVGSALLGGAIAMLFNIVFDWLKGGKNGGGRTGPCSEHSGVLTHISLLREDIAEIKGDVKSLLKCIGGRKGQDE